ncbi:hypothetical protein FACS1894139_05950 [Planctomycetales bacterium]|nr:hypothetical protein FACS1894107_05230 [Planctomycetales bacterium]GHS97580.1 hypothetical protein FACS1894108_04200 [Planctomycetales bacterium]GHT04198.1 hypothetical protein FACS1894139_05950 [Planctomycetales bacterium]
MAVPPTPDTSVTLEEEITDYDKYMRDGEEYLQEKSYYLAVLSFKDALKVPTYEDNAAAKEKLAEAKRLDELAKTKKHNDAAYDKHMRDGKEYLQEKSYYQAILSFGNALKVPTYEDNAAAKEKLAEARQLDEEKKSNENTQPGD